jgi:hypothetical protein
MNLLVMRLSDMVRVHPQQDSAHVCSKCGEPVGIYPSGQSLMQLYPDIVLVCNRCAPPLVLAEPTAEIIQELKDSEWKQ